MEFSDADIIAAARRVQKVRGWFSVRDIYYEFDVGRRSVVRTRNTSARFSQVVKKAGAVSCPGGTTGGDKRYAFPD
ncbi:MAG TPA: hypothetical protein O0X25_04510 [Methanocorpusculum sp.]|mgnify:CR=1 FL=1|nr:hypothetical protein [Methanocorpusculum sp.]HJJ57855.1 hypothetical protein [Methanocorpusculum sp.]